MRDDTSLYLIQYEIGGEYEYIQNTYGHVAKSPWSENCNTTLEVTGDVSDLITFEKPIASLTIRVQTYDILRKGIYSITLTFTQDWEGNYMYD